MTDGARVAIVVVHGIADQQPGQTVREVTRLLCHGGDGEPRYVQGEMHEVLVPVAKLEPLGDHDMEGATGKASARRLPGTPSGFYQTQQWENAAKATAAPARDLGLEMNEYLLSRLKLAQGDALYESTRASLRRRADGKPVDVYEMYWADLSRLGTGGLRALSALYQLFFHLSTLSADLVDHVSLGAGGGRAWGLLRRLHAWMAWLMKAPMALLQLCLLMLVAFGAIGMVAAPEAQGQWLVAIFSVGGIVLASLAVLGWLKQRTPARRASLAALFGMLSLASFFTAVASLNTQYWLHHFYFWASLLLSLGLGSWLVERYSAVARGVKWPGRVLMFATFGAVFVIGRRLLGTVTTQFEWMITAALIVAEYLIAAALLAWALFVLVQVAAIVLGLWLGQSLDDKGKATMQTARLALVGSSGLFALLSLVLWSVISYVAGHSDAMNEVLYTPVLLDAGYRSAAIFVEARIQSLGGFFTPLVFAYTGLAFAAILVLLPSLVEEIKPTTNLDASGLRHGTPDWCRRLGAWLDGGIRMLNLAAKYLVPPGAIAGSLLYLAFAVRQFAPESVFSGGFVATVAGYLDLLRGETLVDAGKWLAGGALTVAALGSRFTRTFGRLRVAIDAVLDIDNYFADPPNGQPPRARIFSRYASLLRYLGDRGYERVVIVAHSQGTVISADLLRYLNVQGRLGDVTGRMAISLVTLGSPLRDLYAERFPLLYTWMGSNAGGFATASPSVADIGAAEWVNAGRSGDYVGRFLWTPKDNGERFRIAMVGDDGKVIASRQDGRTEFCLGAGAHTHYFSNDAVAIAVEIDRLVSN